jgi:hypothetical protein
VTGVKGGTPWCREPDVAKFGAPGLPFA